MLGLSRNSNGEEQVATSSSEARDEAVLDSIRRVGFTMRPMLERALGVDPNNVIQRLLARKRIVSVAGLADNRSYYLDASERALGSKALQQRLALAWFFYMDASVPRVVLKPTELRLLLGEKAPQGPHVLEGGAKARVCSVYAPDTNDVTNTLCKQVARIQRVPHLAASMAAGTYAWAVLLPWSSALLKPIAGAVSQNGEPQRGIDRLLAADRRLQGVTITAHRVASPETLSLALKAVEGRTP